MICHIEMMKEAIVPHFKCSRVSVENHEEHASE
jgi:hypothetical protein